MNKLLIVGVLLLLAAGLFFVVYEAENESFEPSREFTPSQNLLISEGYYDKALNSMRIMNNG